MAGNVLGKLEDARKAFDEASEHHRIVASVGENIVLSTQPKHPRADEEEPLSFEATLAFPDTPEGHAARQDFERHLATGAPFQVDSPHIQQFVAPELLKSYFGAILTLRDSSLVPGEARGCFSLTSRPCYRTAQRSASTRYRFIRSKLDPGSHSTFGVTPWVFTLRMSRETKRVDVSWTFGPRPMNSAAELRIVRFLSALAAGARLVVEDALTELGAFAITVAPDSVSPPRSEHVALLEVIVDIQQRTGVPLAIPDRDLTTRDIAEIYGLANALNTGRATEIVRNLTFKADRALAASVLNEAREGAGRTPIVQNVPNHVWKLLDAEVPRPYYENNCWSWPLPLGGVGP